MRADLRDLVSAHALIPRPRSPIDGRAPLPADDGLADPFVGRPAELAVLRAALDDVRGRRPQVVLVQGAAGMGKTALVERFLQGASDLQVLRCGGERADPIGYDVVDQLFHGAGMTSARLLAGRACGLPSLEPTTVGAQILTFLTEHEVKGPIVLLVDDLHGADHESLRALLFALRRLAVQRVLTLLLTRDEASGPAEGLCRLAARRDGAVLRLTSLTTDDVRTLVSCVIDGSVPTDLPTRLHSHTRGNPSHLRAVLAELSTEDRRTWDQALPAPRRVVRWVRDVLSLCPVPVVRLVEAAAVLGEGSRLTTVASLAGVEDPLTILELASSVELLALHDAPTGRLVAFPRPLVQAAVYELVGPARRVRLHLAAAELVGEDGARLRHRVAAVDPPDEALAAELSEFAQRQARTGAWVGAAAVFLDAARLSGRQGQRDRCLLRAVDLLAGAGEVGRAELLAVDAARVPPGALRDTVLAHLAVVRGRRDEAEALLDSAWTRCDPAGDPGTAALLAERSALHRLGRLRTCAMTDLARPADSEGRISRAALRVVADDFATARAELADAVRVEERIGSVAVRVWGFVWWSRAEFVAGSWDESVVAAARAVALLEETGHEWLRPLARWAAVAVPAARGEWAAAEEHARLAGARGGDYELMVVASGLARAQVAAARADHDGVLRALEPVVELSLREGVDEPGFWPWQGMYGDALVSVGRLGAAEEFLVPHERLAVARGHRSGLAMVARVRGRLEAALGRGEAAEAAFERGLAALSGPPGLSVPFARGLLELAYGQVLRRGGQRRAAVERLGAARDRFAGLGARPFVERCERELSASGLAPAKRHDCDPSRLTAQELAVAQLVARGLSNRQVASELFVSVKTVQFHLTRIYSKLRVSSRAELASSYGDLDDGRPRDDCRAPRDDRAR